MMIPIHSELRDYEIVMRPGVLKDAGWLLPLDRHVLIVTDEGVPKEYVNYVSRASSHPVVLTLPAGEGAKSLENYQKLLLTMLNAGFDRTDAVVAVGGGVVGDLAGFAASTYMRGVSFYNVPTTLLAQVDSSIGGKTAIDLGGVKNVVGSFYSPARVLIDPDLLKTLPPREMRSGLAEVIKMAATSDAALFSLLETTDDLQKVLPEVIRRSLLSKKYVVERDMREQGLRRVLNFGHTVGHAIESAAEGALTHGEAVGIGTLPMAGVAARTRIRSLLEKYDLPTQTAVSKEEILEGIMNDKKRSGNRIASVLVEEIGAYVFRRLLPEEILARVDHAGILI